MNRACIVGNLTRDPELKQTPAGPVCSLRVAVNTRTKRDDEWQDRAHFFNVTVWGKQGESCAEHLAKGRQIAVDGRLEWHEWEGDSGKREAVEIVADRVQFLGSRPDGAEKTPSGGDSDFPF